MKQKILVQLMLQNFLCSQDSTNVLNDLNEYINIAKNGYSFDNNSYHSYYIDQYRDKYIDHIKKIQPLEKFCLRDIICFYQNGFILP